MPDTTLVLNLRRLGELIAAASNKRWADPLQQTWNDVAWELDSLVPREMRQRSALERIATPGAFRSIADIERVAREALQDRTP